MADDSASSKGVSRGDASQNTKSGGTTTSKTTTKAAETKSSVASSKGPGASQAAAKATTAKASTSKAAESTSQKSGGAVASSKGPGASQAAAKASTASTTSKAATSSNKAPAATGPRGPLGPGGQPTTAKQVSAPKTQAAAPGKGSLPSGVRVPSQPTVATSQLASVADPRRKQSAFANPTVPIQSNVLRQQVGTPTQQALAEEARKRRNVGPDNTLGNIVAGTVTKPSPVGPAAPGQQVSDLSGVGAINAVRPGFPTLQPKPTKIAGRVPQGPQVASYDPLTSVNAGGDVLDSMAAPTDLTLAPGKTSVQGPSSVPAVNPSRGVTRPGAPPTVAGGKSDLQTAYNPLSSVQAPAAAAPVSAPGKSDLGGMPVTTAMPAADPRRNQQAFQNPTTPIQGRVLMQQVGTPAQQALAQEAINQRYATTGARGLPGLQPAEVYAGYSNPAVYDAEGGAPYVAPAERVVSVEPYDPALASMPPNPTGARGLPGLQPSDLTAPTDTAEYEGAAPNPGNNVDLRMANYQPNLALGVPDGTDPGDVTAVQQGITGGVPLDADPDVVNAPDEGTFDTGAPPDISGNLYGGSGFNFNGEPGAPQDGGSGYEPPGGSDKDAPLSPLSLGTANALNDGGVTVVDGAPTEPTPTEPTPPGPAPIPGIEQIMPWDVSTYMRVRDIYALSGIDYTPQQFVDEYYDTRKLAQSSVDLPRTTGLSLPAAAPAPTATVAPPVVDINPADELIAA